MKVSIIMRSKDDARVVGGTLAAVVSQRFRDFELINVDSGSSDGTLEIIRQYNPHPLRIDAREYNPGRVLNMAAARARGEYLVFLNSDATPTDEEWLEALIAPLGEPTVAAAFGRQVPRPDAGPLVRKDYQRAFGDGSVASRWRHFFSLASSGIKRSLWQLHPFSTAIQYSEDVEWSYWARRQGYEVRYVPEAAVVHSHNYTVEEAYRRFSGEGEADAFIFDFNRWQSSLLRYALLPCLAEIARDVDFCVRHREWAGVLEAPVYRAVQTFGRYRGLCRGLGRHKHDVYRLRPSAARAEDRL